MTAYRKGCHEYSDPTTEVEDVKNASMLCGSRLGSGRRKQGMR